MNTGMIIDFPTYTGIRCLMMPYAQGYSASVPEQYHVYKDIIDSVFLEKGKIGFLTIDESPAVAGKPHRGDRARYGRALHTEAGQIPGTVTYKGNNILDAGSASGYGRVCNFLRTILCKLLHIGPLQNKGDNDLCLVRLGTCSLDRGAR